MNVNQMIADLQAERQALTSAMAVLESIAQSRGKAARPAPAWLAGVSGVKLQKDKGDKPKRVLSAATKKKMAVAQRKRWAAAKKAQEA